MIEPIRPEELNENEEKLNALSILKINRDSLSNIVCDNSIRINHIRFYLYLQSTLQYTQRAIVYIVDIAIDIAVTMLHNTPPHKVSIILVFRDHPSNIKCAVKSNTAYDAMPNPPPYISESRNKCCFCIFGRTNNNSPADSAIYTNAIE